MQKHYLHRVSTFRSWEKILVVLGLNADIRDDVISQILEIKQNGRNGSYIP